MSSRTPDTRGPIITVCSLKGGVGKSRIAYELATVLEGILIDLDPQRAGVTYAWWGHDVDKYKSRPMIDALESDQTPVPRTRRGRPALVPSHPDLLEVAVDEVELAEAITRWSTEWVRPIVIDTAPGRSVLTDAAVLAADVVVIPVPPGKGEVLGAQDTVENLRDRPIVVVPNRMPHAIDPKWQKALTTLNERDDVRIATPIRNHGLFQRRRDGRPVSAQKKASKKVLNAADEFRTVALEVLDECKQTLKGAA